MASATYAQVCTEPGVPSPTAPASSPLQNTFRDCDMKYRNLVVTCDSSNTYPSCPAKPMPMLDTPLKSFIKDFTPNLYTYARDPNDKTKPYSGTYYRGTVGDPSFSLFQMAGAAPLKRSKQLAACVQQISTPSTPATPEEEAMAIRLQLDNCSNQYILNSAFFPYQKSAAKLLSGEDPNDPSKTITIDTHCQPIDTAVEAKNEYSATEYLTAAWKKTLQDPTYRKTPGAKLEPHLPTGVKLAHPLTMPTETVTVNGKLVTQTPEVRLSNISAVKYEEINDPTHPFSPRWDFIDNERDKYSPKTQAYGGDPQNGVFCAGNKDKDITKVDILTFREKSLDFDKKITDRIDFNKNCLANSGMQANPCCKLNTHGQPNPVLWTCDLLPCATCYKMTPSNPVCATDYVRTPDRGKINKISIMPPGIILPVPPPLRIAGGLNLQSMALSAIAGNTPVALVQGVLTGQLNVLSLLPPNSPISAGIGLLQGNLNVLQALQRSNLLPAQITGALNIVGNLTNQLSNSPLGTVQNLVNTQLKMLGNIPGQNISQALSTITNATGLLNKIGVNTPFGNVQSLLNAQQNMIGSLQRTITHNIANSLNGPIGEALGGIQSLNHLTNSLNQLQTLGQVQGMLQGQVNMLNIIPGGVNVGSVQQAMAGLERQMSGLQSTMSLGQALSSGKLVIDVNLSGINKLPLSTPLGEVITGLNSLQSGMNLLNPTAPITQFTSQLTSHVQDVLSLPNNLPLNQVGAMIGSLQSGITGMGNLVNVAGAVGGLSAPISQMTGHLSAMTGQINALTQLPSTMLTGEVNTMVNALTTGLGGFAKNIPGGLTLQVGQLTSAINNPVASMMQMASGLTNPLGGGLNQLINAQNSFVGAINNAMSGPMASLTSINTQINNVLQGQISTITNAANGLIGPMSNVVSNITGTLNNQLNMVKNLPGVAQIGQFSQMIDNQMFGSINNLMAGLKNIPGASALTSALSGLNIPGLGGLTSAINTIPGVSALMSNIPGLSMLPGLGNIPFLGGFPMTGVPLPWLLVLAAHYDPVAKCTPNEMGPANDTPMSKLCMDLRAPYTGLNKLKMRYHNPNDPATQVLTEGVQEGLLFKDYFGDHMPYPRLWDTGRSIQKSPMTSQDPLDDSGQYTAIVGVGREGDPGGGTNATHHDERCLYGGWGSDVSFGGLNITMPDPVTSWTELKLYQTNMLRRENISCLGRYEKAFKGGSTENMAMLTAGGEWSKLIVSTCPRKGPVSQCKYQTLAQYNANKPAPSNTEVTLTQLTQEGWPWAWRGYLAAKRSNQQFPNFGGSPNLIKGLDEAELGDIILMPEGSAKPGDKPGLPKLAIVAEVNTPKSGNCGTLKNCYVKVFESDNGKWPDVCGTTDTIGEMKTRTVYKPGMLPSNIQAEFNRINSPGSCDDTKLSDCEMLPWDKLEIYRIRTNQRSGCGQDKADKC